MEEDQANLSDEGIIIGETNSNANSEASNSPLPPKNLALEKVEDNRIFHQETEIDNKMVPHNSADVATPEDANKNKCLVSARNQEKTLNSCTDEKDQGKTAQKRRVSNTSVTSLTKNQNNYNNNAVSPQLSSPCDDRVSSRIPLSVEPNY